MNFRRFYTIAILTLAFAAFAFAQGDDDETTASAETRNSIESTTRVAEFGRIGEVERRKRVDVFLLELKENPGAIGYVVFYQGKDALPSQYGLKAEDLYLDHLKFKNADLGSIVLQTSFRDRQMTELWIAPAGQPAPALTGVIAKPVVEESASYLYHRSHFDHAADNFLLPSVIEQRAAAQEEFVRDNAESLMTYEDSGEVTTERSPEAGDFEMFQRSWNTFNEKVKAVADSRGMVIFYADDKVFDVAKLRGDVENHVKTYAARSQLSPDRFQVVFGGYRSGIDIEMWVAPKTAKTPEAKPNKRTSAIE